jgi:hypothetical protein
MYASKVSRFLFIRHRNIVLIKMIKVSKTTFDTFIIFYLYALSYSFYEILDLGVTPRYIVKTVAFRTSVMAS